MSKEIDESIIDQNEINSKEKQGIKESYRAICYVKFHSVLNLLKYRQSQPPFGLPSLTRSSNKDKNYIFDFV